MTRDTSLYDTVLVPTDGSEGTTEALRHAIDLAARHGATVHALYVLDRRPFLAAPDDAQDEVRRSLRERGEEAVGEILERGEEAGVEVVTAIREGIPPKDILAYVEEHDVDAIVMGTHGRTGRDRIVNLGSVTERVVQNATVPVLVVSLDDR